MTSIAVLITAAALAACSSTPDGGDPDALVVFTDAGEIDAAPPGTDGPLSGPCDPVAQTGCEASQKCSIVPTPTPGLAPMIGCVADTGSLQVLDSCTPATPATPDNCARGLSCRGEDDPRCLAFCAQDPDTCTGADICLYAEDLDGDLEGDVRFCARLCDVLAQDCGQPGISCYPTRDGEVCAPEGGGEVPRLEGETCDFANSCGEGLGCFRVGTSPDWSCFKVCDADNTSGPGCAGNQVCNRHESDDWGVCISVF